MQYHCDKIPEVIIISYQGLSNEHVLKNKFTIEETAFKMSTTKIQKNNILLD